MADTATVRFAPSPTGPPHLGNVRTALFNWLLARATGGRFILRIDDTDRKRYDAESERQMLDLLRWLGLDWDEGPDVGGPHAPYRQSERLELYHQAVERLVADGRAYRPAEEPEIVRLRTPRRGTLTFHDLIRGDVTFRYDRLPEDIVLIKSDGFPTYHLATVVDDHAMGITHVLRGEEWIPSTPLHILMFEALGWPPPLFVHLPLVTDRSGQKLKKRDPAFLASTYRQGGYLPEALINYLALLGWHPGTEEEVFTPPELVERFSLERISKSPSAFDGERLRWFNRQHIARLAEERLLQETLPLIRAAYPQAGQYDRAWLARLVRLVRDELSTLNDVVPAVRFAFVPAERPDQFTPEAWEALHSEQASPVLRAFREALLTVRPAEPLHSAEMLRDLRKRFREAEGWGGRTVMFPIRAALTGSVTGPHLSDIVDLLGREECLRRVERALAIIGQ
ncbi:MAG TPA: glutamate--tRNA ligase [Chloroflexi bacterium]|nr:glutamate--tRNA ligase [Chloroflexota bacterium]